MISRLSDLQTDGQQINLNLNINLQGAEGLTEAIMLLLTRATTKDLGPTDLCSSASFERPAETKPASGESKRPISDAKPPSGEPPGESVQTGSLLTTYQQVLKPRRQRTASKKTVEDHETSCRQFDQWCEQQAENNHRFSTPVVVLATDAESPLKFARWLLSAPFSNSLITVNRRVTHILMAAKAAHEAGVIETLKAERPVPEELKRFVKSLSVVEDVPTRRRIPSREEIDSLALHATAAKYPYGDHAAYFWRWWIRYCSLFGPRGRDLVSTDLHKPGLMKSQIIWDTLCPVPDVNNALGRELHSPHGWLHYRIGKDHGSDCPTVLFPMPDWCRASLQFFCELSPGDRVFPGRKQRWLTQKSLSAAFRSIRKAAGVNPSLQLSEGSGNAIAIRKYAANWWRLNVQQAKSDSELGKNVADYVLHHATVTTSDRHYLSVQASVLPVMLELLPSFPKPAADAVPVSLLPE